MDTPVSHRHYLPMAKKQPPKQGTKAEPRRIFPPLSFKAWWKLADVSQREVAEAIRIDETTLSLIGSGGRDYMRYQLEDIAKFLSGKLGQTITPSMLLNPPGAKLLMEVASRLTVKQQERGARMLEEAFPKDDQGS